jgi:hypothetical protein
MQGFALSLLCRTPMTVSFCPVPSPVGLVIKKRLKELFFAILHMLPARRVPLGASVADTQFPLLCDPDHKLNVLELRVEGFLTPILVILLNQGSAGTEYRP